MIGCWFRSQVKSRGWAVNLHVSGQNRLMRCRQKGAKEASDEPQEEKYLLESKSTAFLGEGLPKQQQCES